MTAAATPALGIGAVATPADSLHTITLARFASDDTGEVAGKALLGVQQLIAADTVSLWVPDEGEYECRGALGEQRDLLSSKRVGPSALGQPIDAQSRGVVLSA